MTVAAEAGGLPASALYLVPTAFCLASLMASIESSMTVVGTKLGGNERGGNSLNVAVNAKTSSIEP